MREETIQKQNQVKKLYLLGKSLPEISELTGYKPGSVKTILGKVGIRRKKYIADYMEQLVTMRKDGKSLKEMSKVTGIAISTISEALCKAGLKLHGIHDAYSVPESKVPVLDDAKPVIHRCVVKGKIYQDVTQHYLETEF